MCAHCVFVFAAFNRYSVGSDTCSSGLHMIDLKDPAKPAVAGEYTVPGAATVVEYAALQRHHWISTAFVAQSHECCYVALAAPVVTATSFDASDSWRSPRDAMAWHGRLLQR